MIVTDNLEVKNLVEILSTEGFEYNVKKNSFVTGNSYEITYTHSYNDITILGKSRLTKSVGFSDINQRLKTRIKVIFQKAILPSVKISPISFLSKLFSGRKVKLYGSFLNDEFETEFIESVENYIVKEGWTLEMRDDSLFIQFNHFPNRIDMLIELVKKTKSLIKELRC